MKKLVLSSMFLLLSYSVLASPVLQISPSTRFNFGKYPANIEQRHCFILKNIGSEKLIISKVGVTCGCSAAELFKKELMPEDSTKLYTVIKKESVFGPFSKAFFIHSNAQNGKIQMLTLNGEAIPLITITPSSKIYVGSIPQKQKKEQKFIFTPSAPVELGALNITSDIPVNAKILKVSESQFQLFVTLLPEEKSIPFKCCISIPVKKPDSWKPIEILLQGNVVNYKQ